MLIHQTYIPKNEEAEQALLAAGMTMVQSMRGIDLEPDDFSNGLHGKIWTEVKDALDSGLADDIFFLVKQKFQHQEQAEYINALYAGGVVTYANVSDYAKEIRQKALLRKYIELADDLRKRATDPDFEGSAEGLGGEIAGRLQSSTAKGYKIHTFAELTEQVLNELTVTGKVNTTGYARLDKAMSGGLYAGKLYGIASRMKGGKTTLMSNIAINAAIGGARVLYICLEMGGVEVARRLLATQIGCNALQLMPAKGDDMVAKLSEYRRKVADSVKLGFMDCPRMSLDALRSALSMAGSSGKYDGVVVDYLQLVTGKERDMNGAEHLDNVAQTVAECVKKWPSMWALIAAQINREGLMRGGDGLLAACDMSFNLETQKIEGYHGPITEAWLEMTSSRYTPYLDIGTKEQPGYELQITPGPVYVERKAKL